MNVVKSITNLLCKSMFSSDNLWVTVHQKKAKLKNKMDMMSSIPLAHNDVCHMRRRNKGYNQNTVCERCYSYIQSSIHPVVRVKMDNNSEVLNNPDYKPSTINTINGCLRYISFGDLQNAQQCINIIKHSKANKHLNCAIWTKQMKHFTTAISKVKPLKNLISIWSCSRLNCMNFIIPVNFTKAFYVYTTLEQLHKGMVSAIEQGFKVYECELNCNECLTCYKNTEHMIIFELLK